MNKANCKSYLKNERYYREQNYNQKFIDRLNVKSFCDINLKSLEKILRKDSELFISSFSINVFPQKCYCQNTDEFLNLLSPLQSFVASIRNNPTKQIAGLDSENKLEKSIAEKLTKDKDVNIQLEFYMKRRFYPTKELSDATDFLIKYFPHLSN